MCEWERGAVGDTRCVSVWERRSEGQSSGRVGDLRVTMAGLGGCD